MRETKGNYKIATTWLHIWRVLACMRELPRRLLLQVQHTAITTTCALLWACNPHALHIRCLPWFVYLSQPLKAAFIRLGSALLGPSCAEKRHVSDTKRVQRSCWDRCMLSERELLVTCVHRRSSRVQIALKNIMALM